MIRFQELVPDYYIEKSRDFQVLCRIYDFVFNALKYNIDSMRTITDTRFAKDTILPLIGDKFGIYDKDAYSNRYLLEALPIALKYKGSLKAVNILINAFLDSEEVFDYVAALCARDEESAEVLSETFNRDIKPFTIIIFLSDYPNMTNLHILDEYMKMVLPSGVTIEYMFGSNRQIFDKFKYNEYVFLIYTKATEKDGEMVQNISLVKNKDIKYKGTVNSDNDFINSILSDIDINSVSLASVSGKPTIYALAGDAKVGEAIVRR